MGSISKNQRQFIDNVLHSKNRSTWKVFYDVEDMIAEFSFSPKATTISNLYLKPFFICSPCELIGGNESLKCPSCTSKLNNHGWDSNTRIVEGLKSTMYVISRRYKCNNKECQQTINGVGLLEYLQAGIKNRFPFNLKGSLDSRLIHEDLLNWRRNR